VVSAPLEERRNKMITFKWKMVGVKEDVYLEGKLVGQIRYVKEGWQYFPKGSRKGGEVFSNLSDCEKSLSEE
jgi:hypothetical protein